MSGSAAGAGGSEDGTPSLRGGRGAATVAFCVTGFGKFAGVSENPTSIVVPKLLDIVNTAGDGRYSIVSSTVLETSAVGSTETLESLRKSSADAAASVSASKTIYVHFGVSGQARSFCLEHQATNEATFRVPDERGFNPAGKTIIDSEPFKAVRSTKLPVTKLVEALCSSGLNVKNSHDPGLFVCNHIYYTSLFHTARHDGETSLFVHVPDFSVLNEAQHIEFATALFEQLYVAAMESSFEADSATPTTAGPSVPTSAPPAFDLPADMMGNLALLLPGILGDVLPAPSFKMVILVNMELNMGAGKVASQACHAALGAQRRLMRSDSHLLEQWQSGGEPIIVLKVDNLKQMLELQATAESLMIPSYAIRDAGRTEVASGSQTVVALGPAISTVFDGITGHLKLL